MEYQCCGISDHRDSIVRIIFQPVMIRKGGETYFDKNSGRYVSMGSDGVVQMWTVDLKAIKNFNLNQNTINMRCYM